MDEWVVRIRIAVLGVLLLACIYVWTIPYFSYAQGGTGEFSVTFLDVGQGDAVFIETPEGIQMLIDGGPDGSVLGELAQEMGNFDRTIDMVVATHPDKDHIGGLVDIFERYDVGIILLTENQNDTSVSSIFRERVSVEDAEVLNARAGQRFTLGASTTVDVLFPTNNPSAMESNASSIILKITYGEFDVLLTGDAPSSIESFLIDRYGAALASEVLKLGHHGSRTASSESFIAVVSPEHGVVSAGADNTYGHPHDEVLATAHRYGVVTTTTFDGNVGFVSDGINYRRK